MPGAKFRMNANQAYETIRECFRRFKKKNLDTNSLKEHLKNSQLFELHQLESLDEADTLDDIERLIPSNFTASQSLFTWMESNKLLSDLDEMEKWQLLYALENLVFEEKRYANKSDCKRRMKEIMVAKRLSSHDEKENNKDLMYIVILHSLGNVFELSRLELKNRLLSQLSRHPAYNFELRKIDVDIVNDWLGFIDHLQGWETPGHPFLMHATAEKYNVIVHVLCAASNEEYVFYPRRCYKNLDTVRHIYIGHIYRHHYISLREAPPAFKDMQIQLDEYKNEVKVLRFKLKSLEAQTKIEKERYERNLEEKEEENHALKTRLNNISEEHDQTTRNLVEMTQTARDMNSQFRFMHKYLGKTMNVYSSLDSAESANLDRAMILHMAAAAQLKDKEEPFSSESGFVSTCEDDD